MSLECLQGALESGNNLSEIKFRKKLRTSYPGKEISNCGQRISVRNGGSVEVKAKEITSKSPGPIRFMDHVERTGPRNTNVEQSLLSPS